MIELMSPGGARILVGRNDRENEALVQSAAPKDFWLHVMNGPGAHVVVEEPYDAADVSYAADVAALRSGHAGRLVDVVGCEARHVKASGPPGSVTLESTRRFVGRPGRARVAFAKQR